MITTTTEAKRSEAWLTGLTDLVSYLENLQATNLEMMPIGYSGYVIYVAVNTMEEIAAYAKLFGNCEKYSDTTSIGIKKHFGPHSIDVYVPHGQVCERVVVGTRHVEAQVIEAYDEEIVEWICPPSFLNVD